MDTVGEMLNQKLKILSWFITTKTKIPILLIGTIMQMLKTLGSADNCKPRVDRCCRLLRFLIYMSLTIKRVQSSMCITVLHIYTPTFKIEKNISTARNVNQFTSIIQLSFDNFSSRADQINNEQTFRGYTTARTSPPPARACITLGLLSGVFR